MPEEQGLIDDGIGVLTIPYSVFLMDKKTLEVFSCLLPYQLCIAITKYSLLGA